jgi:hypothetical protein
MQRLSAAERTREELRALMKGELGTAPGRSDLVRLALRLIVEEALEGEVADALRRERYARGAGEKAACGRRHALTTSPSDVTAERSRLHNRSVLNTMAYLPVMLASGRDGACGSAPSARAQARTALPSPFRSGYAGIRRRS